jgi:hypothetical protein
MGIPNEMDKITLDGTVYALDTPGAVLGEPCRKKYPQKQFKTEDEDTWKEWTMPSFHGGERLERILTEDEYNAFRYHDSEGLDQALLSKWGELKLCSSITRSLTVHSVAMPMTVSSDGATLVLGLDESPFVKVWTVAAGWVNATAVAGSGTVTDLITAGATMYAVRGGSILKSTDTGANWLEYNVLTTTVTVDVAGTGYTTIPTVAFTGGGGSGAAGTAAINAGGVTGVTITNVGSGYTSVPTIAFTGGGGADAAAHAHITPQYTTAVGVAYVNGDLFVGKSDGVYNHTDTTSITTEPVTVIAGYRENVYAGRDRRLYRYDGRAWYLYDELPMGFNMTALIPYRDLLLILGYWKVRSGYRSAVYYIKGGSENHLYSVGDYSADWRMYAAAGSDDEIFFANPKRGGADRYDLEVGGISSGPIWGAAGGIPFKSMAVCEGYIWIGRYDNVAGTDGVYYADIQNPTAWKTTGWLTTAEWDFGWSNDVKLFGSILLEHKALIAGQSINVTYSLDGGTTYVDAGTSNAIGTVKKDIPLNNVTGQNLKLKVTLTGPGTSTPTLRKLVVKALGCNDNKWMWDYRALCTRKWKGGALITAFTASMKAQKQMILVDTDGTTANVIIENAVIASSPDPQQASAVINLRLREI